MLTNLDTLKPSFAYLRTT